MFCSYIMCFVANVCSCIMCFVHTLHRSSELLFSLASVTARRAIHLKDFFCPSPYRRRIRQHILHCLVSIFCIASSAYFALLRQHICIACLSFITDIKASCTIRTQIWCHDCHFKISFLYPLSTQRPKYRKFCQNFISHKAFYVHITNKWTLRFFLLVDDKHKGRNNFYFILTFVRDNKKFTILLHSLALRI